MGLYGQIWMGYSPDIMQSFSKFELGGRERKC